MPQSLFAGLRHRISEVIPPGSLRKRFASGAFWSIVGAGASQVAALILAVVRAQILGKFSYGELGVIISTVGMFGVLAGLGFGITATKQVAEFRISDPDRAGRIISLTLGGVFIAGLIVSLIAWLLSEPLAIHRMKAPHLLFDLRLSCALLMLNAIIGVQIGVLSGLEAFKSIARVNVMQAMINLPLGIFGVWQYQIRGAVIALIISAACQIMINFFVIHKEMRNAGIRPTTVGLKKELPPVFKFALPALASALMFGPLIWVLDMMMLEFHENGFDQLGIFKATYQWQAAILLLPTMISQISLPILSNLWAEKQTAKFQRMLVSNFFLLIALALIVAIPIACLSPWLMKIYGADFGSGWPVLVVVCATSILWSGSIVIGNAIWSFGYTRAAVGFTFLRAVLLIGLFYLLYPLGALGLALAFLGTYVLQTIYLVPFVMHQVKKNKTMEI